MDGVVGAEARVDRIWIGTAGERAVEEGGALRRPRSARDGGVHSTVDGGLARPVLVVSLAHDAAELGQDTCESEHRRRPGRDCVEKSRASSRPACDPARVSRACPQAHGRSVVDSWSILEERRGSVLRAGDRPSRFRGHGRAGLDLGHVLSDVSCSALRARARPHRRCGGPRSLTVAPTRSRRRRNRHRIGKAGATSSRARRVREPRQLPQRSTVVDFRTVEAGSRYLGPELAQAGGGEARLDDSGRQSRWRREHRGPRRGTDPSSERRPNSSRQAGQAGRRPSRRVAETCASLDGDAERAGASEAHGRSIQSCRTTPSLLPR